MLRGLELYRMRDVNAPLPVTGLRPDPNFLNIDQFETSGSSHSHSLNLGFRTSVRGKVQLVSQYTLSHAIDDTSGLSSLPADLADNGDIISGAKQLTQAITEDGVVVSEESADGLLTWGHPDQVAFG